MHARTSAILVTASAVAMSYIILIVGSMLPRFFAVSYKLSSPAEVQDFMQGPTRFAVAYSWAFALAIGLIGVVTATLCYRCPTRTSQLTVLGLCAQAALLWVVMFCYCYDGFCGPMSLHHGPNFELPQFVLFEFGVFPVTFVMLTVTILTALTKGRYGNV
ncbi:MAG: hypothetical protein HY298_11090 [Verrucomicrobia bacterium]|nr:hypothetical protein [Verrucomicrobiota bacterium]